MKVKDYKCKCGHNDFFFADKGNQIGIYCSYCGKWYKWAYKDEQNLILKQEPVLDKIKAEIREFSVVDESGIYRISTYLVDQIIDKYRGKINEVSN